MRRSIQHDFVWLLAFVVVLSASCSSAPEEKPQKAVKTVAFISNTSSDFWKVVRKGCEKADAELADVTLAFKMPFGGKAIEQERLINEALNRDGADAIAVSPIDPTEELKTMNNAAKRALLITQDSDAPESDRVLYIGADNIDAGRQAGELMKKALPQGGKIMVFVGKREVQNAQDRYQGLKDSLQGSKIEVLDIMTDNTDKVQAKDNAANTIVKYPDIAGMVGLWSYNGPAILDAVKNADKVGKIKIVCFDDEKITLDAIKAGSIFGTVAQQPYEYGYQGMQLIAKILRGDRSVIPESKKFFIPPVIVQRNNVDEYRNKLNQLVASK
ncbi:MAG: sugar-binding protein [Acidobacteria bacterium]|nr:sugar-binding protein [Acidobacteriota bacterium]